MAKPKRKLTPAEKAEKRRRQKEYITIFINGKQRRVKRPPTIDGIDSHAAPLLTLDRALERAAMRLGVKLMEV